MPRLVGASMQLFIPAILLFVATTASALPGDPPLWGGDCNPDKVFDAKDPDFPVAIPLVHKMIREEGIRLYKAKIDPYLEVDPKTGEKTIYRRRHQPQVDAAGREVEEWQRRAKDKVEKYAEVDPYPDSMGLVIRMKYLDLIWFLRAKGYTVPELIKIGHDLGGLLRRAEVSGIGNIVALEERHLDAIKIANAIYKEKEWEYSKRGFKQYPIIDDLHSCAKALLDGTDICRTAIGANCSGGTSSARRKGDNPPSPAAHYGKKRDGYVISLAREFDREFFSVYRMGKSF